MNPPRSYEDSAAHCPQCGELQTKLLRTEELLAEANLELIGLRDWKRSVDEALNSGDGSYRP